MRPECESSLDFDGSHKKSKRVKGLKIENVCSPKLLNTNGSCRKKRNTPWHSPCGSCVARTAQREEKITRGKVEQPSSFRRRWLSPASALLPQISQIPGIIFVGSQTCICTHGNTLAAAASTTQKYTHPQHQTHYTCVRKALKRLHAHTQHTCVFQVEKKFNSFLCGTPDQCIIVGSVEIGRTYPPSFPARA